ncbi:hypothetical protein [Crocosphaera sp. XPORK-15E]|uniref:hypothetical protein n=1 Tax=Crocosphaera sp. XPORK-15E TaxID=3110247 RepID=UPI002B20DB9F|nr:hypothetical protein [Crocosphaera sp. XPORK-15E]MEA5535495.1 hypothetical protein [Crocosphaera sp. XPORK-15E]
MKNKPIIPETSVNIRLIENLRRARLDFEALGSQFEELIAKFDETLQQQKLPRIKPKQKH